MTAKQGRFIYDDPVGTIVGHLERIERKLAAMAIDQSTFDTDLAALVSAITDLNTAVDALIASKGTADLTAEDQSVQSAAAAVAAELGKLAPPAA